MNIINIEQLVLQDESDTLEFKKSTSKLKEAAQTICAFANCKGGTVLIGVTPDLKIIGQEITDSTQQKIATIRQLFEPNIPLNIEFIAINNTHKIIVIHVIYTQLHPPYLFDGRAYKRVNSTTQRMPATSYQELLDLKRKEHVSNWEDFFTDKTDLYLLDHNLIKQTISIGIEANRIPGAAINESIEDILTNRLNVLKSGKLTNAAIILFGKEDSFVKPQVFIKMARFMGNDKLGNIADNQQIYGNMFYILDRAQKFIAQHVPTRSYFKHDQYERIDKYILPVLAIREAIINALCHQDYSNAYSDPEVALAIYNNRLEIWNSGKLCPGITINDLKKSHASVRRNPNIAMVFYYRNLIEKWGTGTLKIMDLCREHNVPEPEFVEEFHGITIRMPFADPISSQLTYESELTSRQKEILVILGVQKSCSAQQLLSQISDNITARTLQRELKQLSYMGMIASSGGSKNIIWLINK
ncbi:MAG: hypothetical protein COC15_03975 [Legionellales bacterium]|nr:MAG: hypothetical protein COC15_03975 [Legionellales bacterium]